MADLVMRAYGVEPDEVIGPGWMSDREGPNVYVVDATMPPGTTKEQFKLMMQALLKERFLLAVHHEVRNFPGYDLVVSPHGAKLKPGGSLSKDAPTFIRRDSARQEYRQISMAQLADALPVMISESLGVDTRVRVRDKTGLKGRFDSSLEYSCVAGCGPPMLRPRGDAAAAAQGQPAFGAGDPFQNHLPDIVVALEEQMGLKLVKVKTIPVDVIVVDHANKKPTEN